MRKMTLRNSLCSILGSSYSIVQSAFGCIKEKSVTSTGQDTTKNLCDQLPQTLCSMKDIIFTENSDFFEMSTVEYLVSIYVYHRFHLVDSFLYSFKASQKKIGIESMLQLPAEQTKKTYELVWKKR